MPPHGRQSTIPNDTPFPLPPISPPPKQHPQTGAAATHPPVVYTVKLTDSLAHALITGASQSSLTFATPSSGTLSVPGLDQPISFSARPITDAQADTARAVCYSRRATSLRPVGRIHADIDVHQRLSTRLSVPNPAKKRPMEPDRPARTPVATMDHLPAPPKRPRVRKPQLEKRPRAPPRRNALPPPGLRGLRSVPPSATGAVAPTSSSLSDIATRRVSPAARPNALPRPGQRVSPRPPSVHSPSSPRTGSLKAKCDDRKGLRLNVIHMLALGETTVPNLKRRIDLRAVRDAETALRDVLAEVAESGPTKGIYKLRDALACEVTDCYAEYTEMERAKVREWRDAALKSARGKTDDPMTVEQIDGAVDAFERTYKKNVGKIGTEREEGEMRKSFQRLFPLYSAIIARLEHLQKMFITLEKRYREARSKGDMDTWAKKIARTHARFKNQRAKLERVLPLLHSNLKQMRSVLWEFASCQVN